MSLTARAIWYIESHLSGDLSLEEIASVLGVSHFHLSRAFSLTGLSLAAYVRARRLSDAARKLAAGAPDILTVALDCGYGSHEAFTRAFRQHFGLTPEQVRAQASLANLKLMEPLTMQINRTSQIDPPRIAEHKALLIFGLSQRHTGNSNAAIPSQWERFVPYVGRIAGQVGKVSYGVIYNTDEAGNFEYLCGVEVTEFPAEPKDFTPLRIAPQTYVVYEHIGHISAIRATFDAIWNDALPASGHTVADGPFFERYGENFDGRTGLGGLEIWIPVQTA